MINSRERQLLRYADMGSETPDRGRTDVEAAPSSQALESRPGLPIQVRALGVILALDFLIGLWLALHTRGAIAAYLAPQLPVVGLGALCWGFLPDAPKKAFGEWLARALAAPPLFWLAIAGGAWGLGASLFVSTVIVESVDPEVSTTLHIVRGTAAEASREAIESAERLRLNRLTTPQRKHLLISPLGQRVWVHTSTHVSLGDPLVTPWIPSVLQYPDDFERMVVVEVLPNDATLAKLNRGDVKFLAWTEQGGRRIVAEGALHEGSTRIAFADPAAIDEQTLNRWRASLQEIESNPDFVEPMLKAWQRTQWLGTRVPLRPNDELRYEVRSAVDKILLTGKLTLTDVATQLDLSF